MTIYVHAFGEANVPSAKVNENIAKALQKAAFAKMGVTDAELVQNLFASTAEIDGANTTHYLLSSGDVIVADGLDEFEDASINTAIWTITDVGNYTNPSVTSESSSKLRLGGNFGSNQVITSTAVTSGGTGFDPKTFATDCVVEISVDTPAVTSVASASDTLSASIKVGTTVVKTESKGSPAGAKTLDTMPGVYKLFFNYAGGTVTVYKDGSAVAGSPFNISGEANWRLTFVVSDSAGGSETGHTISWPINYVRYLKLDGNTCQLTTAAQTIAAGKVTASPFADVTLNVCTAVAASFSTDNGSHYQSHNNAPTSFTLTNVSTNAKHKVLFTKPTSVTPSGSLTIFPVVNHAYAWVF